MKKITHICLSGPVTDGFLYQDNLLSKYHAKMGFEVSFITSQWILNKAGKLTLTSQTSYTNRDGVKMIRLPMRFNVPYSFKFKFYKGLYDILKQEKPDLIFIHGPQFFEMPSVVKYVKCHKHVYVYMDSHADFSNSGRSFLSKNIFHKCIFRYMTSIIESYTTKIYGVLPARVDFLHDLYHVPSKKLELLVMGADDDLVVEAQNSKQNSKQKFKCNDDDFIIVTGGKIDMFKTEILSLMEIIKESNIPHIKLFVFGSVESKLQKQFNELCTSPKIQYIGWLNAQESYSLFSIASLAIFPGRHSVYWEQAAGQGIPMICKYWNGTTHIDVGGNVFFLYENTKSEMENIISKIIKDKKTYTQMCNISKEKAMKIFSYKEIAKHSIKEFLDK